LFNHIDNLRERERLASIVHPDRTQQILSEKAVSSTPRDLTEDLQLDRILGKAEKKANKIKRLQEGKRKQEAERNQRLQKIRATVISNLSKE
jgi:hypothetical protein